jgi:hypothetical protein
MAASVAAGSDLMVAVIGMGPKLVGIIGPCVEVESIGRMVEFMIAGPSGVGARPKGGAENPVVAV